MISREYFTYMSAQYEGQPPIYEIFLLCEPAKEYVLPSGKPTGTPDCSGGTAGFYYELESAVEALHRNSLDIQDGIYKAAFILCKFPGLYNSAISELRTYFLWDEEKEGFFEADEPDIFKHTAL